MNRRLRTALLLLCVVALLASTQFAYAAGGGRAPEPSKPPRVKASGAGAGDIIEGKWVVTLDVPVNAGSRASLKRAGATVEQVSYNPRRVVVSGSMPAGEAVGRLRKVKGVRGAEPLIRYRAAYTPSDPIYAMQWGLGDGGVSANLAWDTTMGTSDVVIAVIDSGVDLSHPEFAGRLVPGVSFVAGAPTAQDDMGHGSHVAGIAAAASDNATGGVGVAPGCSIMPVKVLAWDGFGVNSGIADGIEWAADHGADVINLSIEGGYSQAIADAIVYAQSKDIVVIAAAGNDGGPVAYPAKYSGVVAVSAVAETLQLASFSNRGPEIDVTAPGVNIWSVRNGGGTTYETGTSMASPFVAGTAALVRSRNPALTQADVVSRLKASATDLGTPGNDNLYGAGLLNAARAVAYATNISDDDIPGLNVPNSPHTGTLDQSSDVHDVWAVALTEGDSLVASITADPGNEFELRMFAPSAHHVEGVDAPVATAPGNEYPQQASFVATQTGVHYIDLKAVSGSGEYTLRYAVVPRDTSDDDVPGVPIPPSPIHDTVSTTFDLDDVYRVYLQPGSQITAKLTGVAGTQFQLFLYAPGVTTVDWPTVPLASATGAYPVTLTRTIKSYEQAGYYYLDVYALSGAGTYALTWSVQNAGVAADDDIPGTILPASPVGGTLLSGVDDDDVNWVDLDAGERFDVALTGPVGTDFDIYLFGPTATHIVAPDTPVASSDASGTSSESFSYTAPVAGRYYLDTSSYYGSGSYTLTWARDGGPDDDGIPGIALPASPVRRLLGVAGDTNDVFGVALDAGQQLTVSMDMTTGPDFDLFLYEPGAASIGATEPLAASYWHGDPEHITFIAPEAGTYHLDARRFSGSGLYTLDYTVGPATALPASVSVAATQPVGATAVSLTATVTAGGNPVANATIALEAWFEGGWRYIAAATTDADGVSTTTVEVPGALQFRARHSGDAATAATTSNVAQIPQRQAAYATLAASTRTPAYLGAVTLTARATDAGSAPIEGPLRIERLSGAEWVAVPATVTSTGTVTATVKLTSAATYRAVYAGSEAYHRGDSTTVLVRPKVRLTAPYAPSSIKPNTRFTSSGTLWPRHTAGTKPVKILCYRIENGKYVLRRAYWASVRNYYSASRYSATVSLPYRGTWVLRAYTPTDSGHLATYGPLSRRVTVR